MFAINDNVDGHDNFAIIIIVIYKCRVVSAANVVQNTREITSKLFIIIIHMLFNKLLIIVIHTPLNKLLIIAAHVLSNQFIHLVLSLVLKDLEVLLVKMDQQAL
ncbi:Hypothetical protein HVR_LOCUS791 [uncultured virus]|nr:Hypothetical protein HVR_LOCUS791 [uncultured virus]